MSTSIKLGSELKDRIQDLADARQRSAHWIAREPIHQYVVHEETKERFRREALASWTAYRETGRHLTGQEVRGWLNTWEDDNGTERPSCHE